MAFENIDVNSLRTALNSCKNSINNGISLNLQDGVMKNDYWYCDARNVLKILY